MVCMQGHLWRSFSVLGLLEMESVIWAYYHYFLKGHVGGVGRAAHADQQLCTCAHVHVCVLTTDGLLSITTDGLFQTFSKNSILRENKHVMCL